MICSKSVFRCFKTIERCGDRITGAAGPFFVTLALALLSTGAVCFCELYLTILEAHFFFQLTTCNINIDGVIAPSLSFPIISIPICLLITLNLFMHYFYAITVSPGFLDDPPRDPPNSFLWARKAKDKGKQRMISGVRWSAKGTTKITPASTTKCRKCSKFRPEVSYWVLNF
jgi:palmitoyltransferase